MTHLDARTRVLAALAFALAVVAIHTLAAALFALALAVACALAARLAPGPSLRKLAALDGFVLVAIATLPFTIAGETWFTLAGLPASREGALRGLLIVLKANAIVLTVLALVGPLEPSRLGHALGSLGLPAKLVQLMLFTIRYLAVIEDEYGRLRTAMRARAFRMGTDRHTWRALGQLFGMLLVRSVERSERVLAAMRCRGFDGTFRPLAPATALGRADAAFMLAALAGLAALAWVEVS